MPFVKTTLVGSEAFRYEFSTEILNKIPFLIVPCPFIRFESIMQFNFKLSILLSI
jgi:hypothetical protein